MCDIQLPEVQEKLRKLNDATTYDPKTGWLTEIFYDFVREQIDKYIVAHLQIEGTSVIIFTLVYTIIINRCISSRAPA